MALVAQIKFVQGATIGTPGVALAGVSGTLVTASNGDDSSVKRWQWTMVGTPSASSIPQGLISDGPVTAATFTPDVAGGYHLQLVTFDAAGNSVTDRRVFQVPELSGRYIPPFDAEAPAMNFLGQLRGWALYLEAYLKYVDTIISVLGSVPVNYQTVNTYTLQLSDRGGVVTMSSAGTTTVSMPASPANGDTYTVMNACGATFNVSGNGNSFYTASGSAATVPLINASSGTWTWFGTVGGHTVNFWMRTA